MTSPLSVFPPNNPYGRETLPGVKAFTTTQKLRKIASARKELYHRTKNGIFDPVTYFHILDALLELVPGETFQTRDFVAYLSSTRDQLVWDTTTVGRVVNDIADNLEEANGVKVIDSARRWNGMLYSIRSDAESRAALYHLLDDLLRLSKEFIERENRGEAPKRIDSPLLSCPSVMKVG